MVPIKTLSTTFPIFMDRMVLSTMSKVQLIPQQIFIMANTELTQMVGLMLNITVNLIN